MFQNIPNKNINSNKNSKVNKETSNQVEVKAVDKAKPKTNDYFEEQGTAQLEQMKALYGLGVNYFPVFLVAGLV
ncbi:MAG: hypothetical protein WAQ98_17325, partial [Blastocatellia bacterium]